jgi:anti-sigma B factor antagonist
MAGIASRIESGDSEPAQLIVERLDRESDVITFVVAGQLDVSTEAELRDALQEALKDEPKRIVLDVSSLDFMDSSGLAVLIVAARQVEVVELLNPTSVIRRVITLTGLTQILRMTPDE